MAVSGDAEGLLAAKFAVMRPFLDERRWRVYLGSEARALGHGGIRVAARAAGVAESAVAAGVAEAGAGEAGALPPGRARRAGGGRGRLEAVDPGLMAAVRELVEGSTRGDPVVAVLWTTLSLRDIAREVTARGHSCGKDAIARVPREMGYSLQGASRVLEGSQHPGRDAQFRHVNAMIAELTAAGDPVVSVDGKKKEQLGPCYRAGRSWRPGGDPVKVRDHDFPDGEAGRIAPYGIYGIAANRGFACAGAGGDTAAFAVASLRRRRQDEGAARYPGARRLLVTCDAGGPSGYRCRLGKGQLARLAAQTGLEVRVRRFPPGTSKWNKIGRRLFCHITRSWRGRPLMSIEDAVAGIAATTTYQGLKCTAVIDGAHCPAGTSASDERMRYLDERALGRHGVHGEWNHAVPPGPRARPGPRPGPGAGRPLPGQRAEPPRAGRHGPP